MKRLVMCQGLPGSGKSTWAKSKAVGPGVVRVNKDDIRAQLTESGKWQWSPTNESLVIEIRNTTIAKALANSEVHTVISDDTNFGRTHKVALMDLALKGGAMLEIKKFDTPLTECIRRDALRDTPVGEQVIRKMAAQYGLLSNETPPIVPIEQDETLMSAIICDLDGTLALFSGQRSPYDHGKCAEDRINEPVRNILEVYYRFMQWQIIYLTGREDRFRVPTDQFRRKHHCPPGPLHMRPTGDFRKDSIIKTELFDQHVRGKYRVRFVLDDRNSVVAMWRALGLTCLQVADGDF